MTLPPPDYRTCALAGHPPGEPATAQALEHRARHDNWTPERYKEAS